MQQSEDKWSFVDEIPYFVSLIGGFLCLLLATQELIPDNKLAQVCSMMFIYSNLFAFFRGKGWAFHAGHILFWSIILFSFADFYPLLKGADQAPWTIFAFIMIYAVAGLVQQFKQKV